ncbi:MAG: UDP-N-acetylglucosamine 1-carboxyvinyltransferase [Bacillota bacterium]|nr:UDP-N-acetylglucosamine 1-carboxyvinyltransferase [Bacillota bacterium]
MDKFVINGKNKLYGEVDISGAKNAAVAILPAVLLTRGECTIENIPDVQDINYILDVLSLLGAKVERLNRNTVRIDASGKINTVADYEILNHMRASYYIVGALLGRFGKAEVSMPGGCNFGERPVDLHKKGFEAMGAKVSVSGVFKAEAEHLRGANIYLDTVSVGATINIMIAAVLADGMTVIENVAREPHIVDVANFLNAMGGDIKGAGTDVIRINGVKELKDSITYTLIPDQIEAGTFMVAAAAAGGNVLIKNVIPKHLEAISAKLEEMHIEVQEFSDSIRIISSGITDKINLKALPYPGFPTDMQPIAVALLTTARGTSMVTEGVWESRFQYVDELRRMGAHITVNGRMAVIEGVESLTGATVNATDLRAGAAMVVAALMADGCTTVRSIKYIDRGYEHFEEKLRALGADIQRVSDPYEC